MNKGKRKRFKAKKERMVAKSGENINIIGAGIAGLSAAIYLAENDIPSRLISRQPSERAQSVLAEGGINAALDTMGEGDSVEEHIADTLRGGVYLADKEAVRGLCEAAPGLVSRLWELGVPFHAEGERIIQRNFGGQKKKRTAYAKSSSGKAIMTALIDEARKHEAEGLIERLPRHELCGLLTEPAESVKNAANTETDTGVKNTETGGVTIKKRLKGLWVRDTYGGEVSFLGGPAILCTGGLNGFFKGHTTGTTANDGSAAALAFDAGAAFANLEMIQYHPTTAAIAGKRLLISEAARGEGGRLYINRDGVPWYFMEEKYPELGNLMPRDVISREMASVLKDEACEAPVYLDLTGLSKDVWKSKLSDLRDEIKDYLAIEPAREPVPVEPGIHFFMGGLRVDKEHRTNIEGLYAAGEAAAIYHGANRLGGNSLLGALYGGRVAAKTASEDMGANSIAVTNAAGEFSALSVGKGSGSTDGSTQKSLGLGVGTATSREKGAKHPTRLYDAKNVRPSFDSVLSETLLSGLGIVRDEEGMMAALARLDALENGGLTAEEAMRLSFGRAMLISAIGRRESRGAHYRSDYPERDDENFGRESLTIKSGGALR